MMRWLTSWLGRGTPSRTAPPRLTQLDERCVPAVHSFFDFPARLDTNLSNGYLSGPADPTDVVRINNVVVPPAGRDAQGAFVAVVTLTPGSNTFAVTVEPVTGVPTTTTRTLVYDPALSTAGRALLYADIVPDGSGPAVDGTVVIDTESYFPLGFLPGRHVRGIAPDFSEVYTHDRLVVSTASHQVIRTLPLAADILAEGYALSPDGTRLFSGTEVVNVASNTLEAPLPADITLAPGFAGAPAAGGPAVSPDGAVIYAVEDNDIVRIDVPGRAVLATGISGPGFISDMKVSPDGTRLIVSRYGGGGGAVVYDTTTYSLLATLPGGDFNGQVGFLNSDWFVAGAAGNPRNRGGGIGVYSLDSLGLLSYLPGVLSDDVATQLGRNTVFAGSGDRAGVDILAVSPSGVATVTETVFLGVGRFEAATGRPVNDQYRGLVYKPAPNRPPVLAPVGDRTVARGTALMLTLQAADPDGGPLTFTLVSGPPGLTVDAATGDVSWPAANTQTAGRYGATFRVTDDAGLAADETISLTVTAPPTAAADTPTVAEDAGPTAVDVLANDSTVPEGDTLTVTAATQPSHGAVTLVGGVVRYAPAADYNGPDTFTYTIADGNGGTATAVVSVTVTAVNDAPVLAAVGNRSVGEGTALNFTAAATDVDGPTPTYSLVGAPAGATIGSADGAFSWTPTEAQGPGVFTFRVRATDAGGLFDEEELTVVVAEVNRPPVLAPVGSRTLDEEQQLVLGVVGTDPDQPANPLTYTATNLPAGAAFDAASRVLTWTPTEAQDGTYAVTFTVSDGVLTASETVQLVVREVNRPPALAPIPDATAEEGVPFVLTPTATDPDLPAAAFTFALAAAPVGMSIDPLTGRLTWTPDETQGGAAHPVTVTVLDGGSPGLSDSRTFSITVAEVNRPPVLSPVGDRAVQVGTTLRLGVSATDPDVPANPVRFRLVDAPVGMTIDPLGGAVEWAVPAGTPPGAYPVTVVADDLGTPSRSASETITVSVTTTPPNTRPTVTAVANQWVAANGSTGALAFRVGDAETSAGLLAVAAFSSDPSLLPVAGLVLGGAGADRTIIVTPAAGSTGTATVTVRVSDGELDTDITFTVTVAAPPRPVAPHEFGVGAGAGGPPVVRFYDPNGSVRFSQTALAGAGGVRTAAADFTGDGVADPVVGTGPGVATFVRVLDGVTQAELFAVAPFEAAFTGGVYVAAGDLTGDGIADLVVTPDEGGGPRVVVYRGGDFARVANFFGIDDPNFRGGARAAVGDLDGDGRADLVVAAGFGGGPRVAAFSGRSVGDGLPPAKLFNDLFVFEQALRNGAFIAVGDVDGDGRGELIAGGGPGGGPRVLALSGADLMDGRSDGSRVVANFFAGNVQNRGGVRVAVKDLDGDRFADLVVGDGTGGGSRVTGYLGKNFGGGGGAPEAFGFDAFPGLTTGVFVG